MPLLGGTGSAWLRTIHCYAQGDPWVSAFTQAHTGGCDTCPEVRGHLPMTPEPHTGAIFCRPHSNLQAPANSDS